MNLEEYTPFWTERFENFSDPNCWIPFVCQRKYFKRRLMIGADHFNCDTKKGLEFVQGMHLLPDKLIPKEWPAFSNTLLGWIRILLVIS